MPARAASANLLSAIASGAPSLAVLLKVVRSDATVIGFTNLPAGLTYDGVTYLPGLDPTIVSGAINLSVDNLESSGLYSEGVITESEVAAGIYDSARYTLMVVDYDSLADLHMTLQRGKVRKIESQDSKFTVSLASLSALLQANVGHLLAPHCQVKEVFDAECGLNENGTHPTLSIAYKHTGLTVASVINRISFTITGTSVPTEFFNNGKITWTAGVNSGVESEVKSYTKSGTTGTFTLQEPPRKGALTVGQVFRASFGCNRSHARCLSVNNVINMRRSAPFAVGIRRLLTTR